jgi:RecB family exonuclease
MDAVMAAGVEVLDARRSGVFTRFDGHVSGVALPSPVDRGASATTLESWVRCPFAYFMQALLRVDPVERPEDELVLTPLEKGSLVHEVLERFLVDAMQEPAARALTEGRAWDDEDRRRLREIAEEVCDEFERSGRTGRPFFWVRQRRKVLAEIARFADEDARFRREGPLTPVATELPFGLRTGGPPVPLPIPGGRAVPFRGKADRVDVGADGAITVVDYKTGKASGYAKLSEEDPVLRGAKLQLPVYGLAARAHLGTPDAPVEARYWFVTEDGGFERKGYPVTDAVLEHAGEVVGRIVEGIEGGVFVSHPEVNQPWYRRRCPYCDPDGLGTTELRRQLERKAADPALAAYLELAEPDLVEP